MTKAVRRMPKNRKAERPRPALVVARRREGVTEGRVRQRPQEHDRDDEQAQHHPVERPRVLQIDKRHARDGRFGLEVDVGPVRSARELGVVEEEEQHLPEGQRDHDEVDAPGAQGERPDHQRGERSDADRERQGEPKRRRLRRRGGERERVARKPEERGMTEAHQTAEPDDEVQRHGEQAEEKNSA
jgi:hypothetical protein